MRTITDIRNEYKRLDSEFGYNIANQYKLKVSKRLTKTRGYCKIDFMRRAKEIQIADFVMTEPDETFYNTIRHEYAHAMAYEKYGAGVGHDARWKALAKMVGCNGEQYAKATKEQIDKMATRVNYIVECKHCGRQFKYMRMNNTIRMAYLGDCRCPCGCDEFEIYRTDGTPIQW